MKNFLIDKLKALSEVLIRIEEKLGLTKFIRYMIFLAIILGIVEFPKIVESVMKIQAQIERQEHEKRMLLRDDLVSELDPLLVELRSSTGASRLLYFEYHNSTENFVGIPFKYANLVLSNQMYGCPGYDPDKYRDINTSLISKIYTDLRKNEIIINRGIGYDTQFYATYPEIHNLFSTRDESSQQVYINIPGINSPIGMIVLEWVGDNEIKSEKEWIKVEEIVLKYVPRINGIITKYTPELS